MRLLRHDCNERLFIYQILFSYTNMLMAINTEDKAAGRIYMLFDPIIQTFFSSSLLNLRREISMHILMT